MEDIVETEADQAEADKDSKANSSVGDSAKPMDQQAEHEVEREKEDA